MEAADNPTESGKKGRAYRCFLVRCWCEEDAGAGGEAAGRPAWRFTVQQVGPGAARRSFACLEDLEAFLEIEFAEIEKEVFA